MLEVVLEVLAWRGGYEPAVRLVSRETGVWLERAIRVGTLKALLHALPGY